MRTETIAMGRLCKAAAMGLALIFLLSGRAPAETEVMAGAEVLGDPGAVKAVLATFDRAEEALRTESLSGIMALYSNAYRYRGMGREDVSRAWEEIFARYDGLTSKHVFSKIAVGPRAFRKAPMTARVGCHGILFGIPAPSKERKSSAEASMTKPAPIDTWFGATHYLVLEGGRWKISGHDHPAGKEQDPIGVALHLLF